MSQMRNYNFLKDMLNHQMGKGYTTKIQELENVKIVIPSHRYILGISFNRNKQYVTSAFNLNRTTFDKLMIPDNSFLECIVNEIDEALELKNGAKENAQIHYLKNKLTEKDKEIERLKSDIIGPLMYLIFTNKLNLFKD